MTRADAGRIEDLYEEILRDYGPALGRVAAIYERNAGRREELFQEICFALWRALGGFERRSSLRTFVFRIAHNRGLTHRWRHHRADAEPLQAAGDPRDPAPGPEESALASQRRLKLKEAVECLSLGQRQVIALTLDGLSQSEIAEVLGISGNNVAVRVTRARARLKELMSREGRSS